MAILYLLGMKRLLTRPLAVTLSLIGIAAGVGLVVSVNVVIGSVGASIDKISELDRSSDVLISARSPLGFPIELADQALLDPSVRSVQPQVHSAVIVNGQPAVIVGRRDIAAPLVGDAMSSPVQVQTAAGVTIIHAERAPSGPAAINGGRVVFVPLEQAWDVLGRPAGVVDSAALDLDQGDSAAVMARLEDRLGSPVTIGPADGPQQLALNQLQQVQQPLFLMATIALVAGGFLIFNTVQSSARAQARALAVLKALGATRRQVAGGLVLEALALGLVGSALGVGFGSLLGRTIVGALPDLVDTVAGTEVRHHWDWRALPSAMLLGVVVALLSAILPIRSVLRARPDHVLGRRPPSLEPGLSHAGRAHAWRARPGAVIAGVAMLVGGGVACTSTDIQIAQNGIGALFLGLIVLGFGLAAQLSSIVGWVANQMGSLGSLTAVDVRYSQRRVWSVAAAVFTAVGMALAVGGAARNQTDTLVKQFAPVKDVDLIASPVGAGDLPLGFYYPISALSEIAALDGVAEARGSTTAFSIREGRRFVVLASDGPMQAPSLKLAPREAVEKVVDGSGAVVTVQYAREFGLAVGDVMELDGITGPIRLPIAAVTTATTVSVSGAVHVNRAVFAEAFGDPGVNTIEIWTEDGADVDTIGEGVYDILDGSGAPVLLFTGEGWFDEIIGETADAVNVFLVVATMVVAVAGIATLNATASSVVERRRILGVVRALGATPSQVRRMVMIEVIAAGGVGTVLGLVFGSALHWVAVYVTNNSTPFPEEYSFSTSSLIQALASSVFAVALGGLLPAWQTGRARIADAIAFD